jgi:membrane protein required for colicin V production
MPSYFDLAVFIIVALSCLLATLRGFSRNFLSLLPWVASAGIAYFSYPLAVPLINPYVHKIETASALAIASIFFGALIITSLSSVILSGILLDTTIGIRDRILGFVYGTLRGVLLAIIAFSLYDWLVTATDQPIWVREAYTKPMLQNTREAIRQYLPDNVDSAIAKIKAKIALPVNEAPLTEQKSDNGLSQPDSGALPATPSPETLNNPTKLENAPSETAPLQTPITPMTSTVETKPEKAPSEGVATSSTNQPAPNSSATESSPMKTPPEPTTASSLAMPSTSPVEAKPTGSPN